MNRSVRIAALGMMILVAGSGCASNPSAPTETSEGSGPSAASTEHEPLPDTGIVRGVVTNDELFPLGNVRVSIEALNRSVSSDEYGAYTLADVPPGGYAVEFEGDGFSRQLKSVAVVAGGIAWLNVTLAAKEARFPYIEKLQWTGHLLVASWWVVENTEANCPKCMLDIPIKDDARQLQFEFFYTPSTLGSNVCYNLLRNRTATSVGAADSFFSGCLSPGGAKSIVAPVELRPWDHVVTVQLRGGNPSPSVDQQVDVRVSIGHYDVLPPGWTLADPK